MSKRAIGLFGESGSGKTHIVQTIAQAVGMTLKSIQFNAETGFYLLIISFENIKITKKQINFLLFYRFFIHDWSIRN
jgi:ABC-type glutathione transport system ATPase component